MSLLSLVMLCHFGLIHPVLNGFNESCLVYVTLNWLL